jgi:hypothetical protein
VRCRLRHARERLEDLILGAVQILQLFDVQVAQGFHFHVVLLRVGVIWVGRRCRDGDKGKGGAADAFGNRPLDAVA